MYIDVVPNRNSPPAVLLRESVRDGRRTLKRTLANLSALPEEAVAALRVVLRGGRLGKLGDRPQKEAPTNSTNLGDRPQKDADTNLGDRPQKDERQIACPA